LFVFPKTNQTKKVSRKASRGRVFMGWARV
jgi:hypothetical protein